MLIQDVTITNTDGTTLVIRGVAKKVIRPVSPNMAIMELVSALEVALGMVVLQPGMCMTFSQSSIAIEGGLDGQRLLAGTTEDV